MNKNWSLDLKFQSDEKSYDSLKLNDGQIGRLIGTSILAMKAAEAGDVHTISTNVSVSISYTF